jgi:hypothetical protein
MDVKRRVAEIEVRVAELESQAWTEDLAKERAALLCEREALFADGKTWLQQMIDG